MRIALVLLLAQDVSKDELRDGLRDDAPKGAWIYDDLDAGLAEAKKSGKPLFVAARCVPWGSCREIDRRVAGREDPALARLMDRFVCVRLVQAWGVDLDLVPSSTLAFVFMNADGAVYGRCGPRDLPALAGALEGALALHAKWPTNRAELEGKKAPALPWRRTSDVPALRDKFGPAGLQGRGCLHCHDVREGVVRSLEREKRPVPARLSTPYPTPERAGMSLLPGAVVGEVRTGGPAETAGLKAGDRISRLGGQPILSVADVEWALYVAPDEGELAAEVEGRPLKIRLSKGWRNP